MSRGKKPFSFPVDDSGFKKSRYCRKVCLLVNRTVDGVAIRDSKDPTKNTLYYKHTEWKAFVKGVKNGEFDLD